MFMKENPEKIYIYVFFLVPMRLKILQLCYLWFLLQIKHKTSALFLDFLVPVIKDGALNKSELGSAKKNFSLTINSS